MNKALVLVDKRLKLSERYIVHLRVLKVMACRKYPEGIKAKYILIDIIKQQPRLLIDNHAPFGFHVHESLPENKHARRRLETSDYAEALNEFHRLIKEIIHYEN